MAQINYQYQANYQLSVSGVHTVFHGSLSLFPFNIYESISLNKFILGAKGASTNAKVTYSLGMYSLTGATFNLANSATASMSHSSISLMNFTNWSSTQNITPGTWYVGLVGSTSAANNRILANTISADSAFPNAYIGGNFLTSTLALPATINTSSIDTNAGNEAFNIPYMIVSA